MLVVHILVRALGLGLFFGLLQLNAELALAPLSLAEEGLCLLVLWVGAWLALRPGALRAPALLRQAWAAGLAALLFLGSVGLGMLLPVVKTWWLGRYIPVETFADHVMGTTWIGAATTVIRALTWALILVLLFLRLRGETRTGR